MTAPPLPASPCLRLKLDYTNSDTFRGGNRLYLSYTGAAPTAANCTTIAGDIATAWNSYLASLVQSEWSLVEVDVLDIASLTGASGQWTGSHAGTDTSDQQAAQLATNIEFNIARRYRGGKPRMFLPPPGTATGEDASHFTDDFVTNVNTGVSAFFAALAAIDVGAVGVLAHVNLSYYTGFKNITNSSGRERAVPTYRDAALLDSITGYACKKVYGSQRRRRTATSY